MSPVTAHQLLSPLGALPNRFVVFLPSPSPGEGQEGEGAPAPLAVAQSPPCPLGAQRWHLGLSPLCTGGTRGHVGQVIHFSNLQGVLIHEERALSFYSPSGWEGQWWDPHAGVFSTGEVTTLGTC